MAERTLGLEGVSRDEKILEGRGVWKELGVEETLHGESCRSKGGGGVQGGEEAKKQLPE